MTAVAQTEMQYVVSIRSINKALFCKFEKSLSAEKTVAKPNSSLEF